MSFTQETRVGLWALLGLQLVTSMTAILLLGRMGPAIERIIVDNVYSTEAVEDMLVALSRPDGHDAFIDAYTRARGNVTEPAEEPLLDTIERWDEAALAGDPTARAEVLEALQELAAVNRASIVTADERASRLSLAGAWAMVLMGLVGFLASVGVWRRVDGRLLVPIQQVAHVVRQVRSGQHRRRCTVELDGSAAMLADDVNWLIDQLDGSAPTPRAELPVRRALLAVLDRSVAVPAIVGTGGGEVLASNTAALEATVPARSVARAIGADAPPPGWEVEALTDTVWLARWTAPA